jgi:hypothetical protein
MSAVPQGTAVALRQLDVSPTRYKSKSVSPSRSNVLEPLPERSSKSVASAALPNTRNTKVPHPRRRRCREWIERHSVISLFGLDVGAGGPIREAELVWQ